MIQFLISAAFVLVFLFVFVLLASGMFWVVVRVLRNVPLGSVWASVGNAYCISPDNRPPKGGYRRAVY